MAFVAVPSMHTLQRWYAKSLFVLAQTQLRRTSALQRATCLDALLGDGALPVAPYEWRRLTNAMRAASAASVTGSVTRIEWVCCSRSTVSVYVT